MSFLKSIFFGSPGEYKLNDINIKFDDADSVNNVFAKDTFIGKAVELIMTNRAVQVLSLGYVHVLLHELSHVYMAKLCDREPTGGGEHWIKIDTSNCRGGSGNYWDPGDLNVYGDPTHTRWTQCICLAGSLGSVGFETIKLISGIAAANLLPQPIGMALGTFIAIGAAYWIIGEALYACYGGGDYLALTMFERTRKKQLACRKDLKEKKLNIEDFQDFKQKPDQISFWNLFKRTTPVPKRN